MAHGLETMKYLNAKAAKNSSYSRCTIVLPRNYNNGTRIAATKLDEILLALGRLFGGYTFGESTGYYNEQIEPGFTVVVTIPTYRVTEFKNVVRSLKDDLQQKTIYFECSEVDFELL